MFKTLAKLALFNLVVGVAHAEETCIIYPENGPFLTGNFQKQSPQSSGNLKFVSYNIGLSDDIGQLTKDIQNNDTLKDADFIVLQEAASGIGTDDSNAKKLAAELKMNYLFSPNIVLWGKDYGNAILSRWPLVSKKKVYLPLSTKENCNQRSMVMGVYDTPQGKIQVASVHLSVTFGNTFFGGDASRADQFEVGIKFLAQSKLPSFVAGDLNTVHPGGTRRVIRMAESYGFYVAQPEAGWTHKKHNFQLDRAFATEDFDIVSSGIEYNAEASDHVPIWTEVKLK